MSLRRMRGTRESIDAHDLEELVQLRDGRPWAMVKQRVEAMYSKLAKELRTTTTWDTTLRLQGQLAAIETILSIPELVIDETRQKLRKATTK